LQHKGVIENRVEQAVSHTRFQQYLYEYWIARYITAPSKIHVGIYIKLS